MKSKKRCNVMGADTGEGGTGQLHALRAEPAGAVELQNIRVGRDPEGSPSPSPVSPQLTKQRWLLLGSSEPQNR